MKVHTKESIRDLLSERDDAIIKAILVLADLQTQDEQAHECTKHLNGEGFQPCDAYMGTNLAKFYRKKGYLSKRQLNYFKRIQKNGRMRICKYAGQLAKIANSNEVKKAAGLQRQLNMA